MQSTISAYIISLNEEENIARAITSVSWMDEVVVLDSGSTDDTLAIARSLGAKTAVEPFAGYSTQKNRAMKLCGSEWLFNIDADEEMTAELADSIRKFFDSASVGVRDCYEMTRKTWYFGRWIKHCGWYPEYRTRLSRAKSSRWTGGYLHEHLEGKTSPGRLEGDLLHRPYRDLNDHFQTIGRYSRIWAKEKASEGKRAGVVAMIVHPVGKFLKMFVLRSGFRDGVPGFMASVMGCVYVFMKYAHLSELQRKSQ